VAQEVVHPHLVRLHNRAWGGFWGVRYAAINATTREQIAVVRQRATCCDGCTMGIVPGDTGAAQRKNCLENCDRSNPMPQK